MVFKTRGVTLIELLLVTALLGLILLLAYPSFGPMRSKYTLEKDAKQMAWTLRSARQKAITTGEPQYVEFKPYAGKYEYNEEEIKLSDGIKYVGTTTFPKRSNGMIICSFACTGVPANGGTVTLKDKYNNYLYIIVNPVGGRVRISTVPPKT